MSAVIAILAQNQEENADHQPEENVKRVQFTEKRHTLRLLSSESVALMNDNSFKEHFRLSRNSFQILFEKLGKYLKQGQTKYAIPIETKLLVVIRFLAQGSYQLSVGNDSHVTMGKSTVSKILHEVLDVINDYLCPELITLPTAQEMKKTSAWAVRKYRIPGVIGMIDGTHICIKPPASEDSEFPEFIYVNRKKFHSLNTQIICDHKYKIWNVNPRFPGSAHDSYIWKQTSIRQYLLDNHSGNNIWLLGDSGYPLEPILIVPFKSAQEGSGERLFNEYHSKCRSTVERCIGLLKGRWRCLKMERGLHYDPTTAAKIINACVALHNFCISQDRTYCNLILEPENEVPVEPAQRGTLHEQGSQIRNMLIGYILQRA